MSESLNWSVQSVVKFPVGEIAEHYAREIEHAEETAAKVGARWAKKYFTQQYRALRPHQNTEHVIDSFKAFPSKYGRWRGWVYGVFHSGKKNKWGVTVGTRAHFFEYGNSRQPGRPYMTPSKHAVRQAFLLQLDRNMKKVADEQNRRYYR